MSAIVPGLGFTRLRGVLLMLGEAVRLVFGGTSRIGMVYVHLFKVLAKSGEPCRRTDPGEHPAPA
ncbi:MAG: hypothetical protein IPP12_22305 [Nitrospira sp.]|nr:hypothetical protein [Nitrospira sp.]